MQVIHSLFLLFEKSYGSKKTEIVDTYVWVNTKVNEMLEEGFMQYSVYNTYQRISSFFEHFHCRGKIKTDKMLLCSKYYQISSA